MGCDLESVIATHDLKQRATRKPDWNAETQAELELTQELARSPKDFFQKLVDMVLRLTVADSAGISLLNEQTGRFVWPAVAGGLFPYLGEGTPRNFGRAAPFSIAISPFCFCTPNGISPISSPSGLP